MNDATNVSSESPRPNILEKGMDILLFQGTPYLGLLFVSSLFLGMCILIPSALFYIPWDDFVTRMVRIGLLLLIFLVFAVIISAKAFHFIAKKLVATKWLQVLLTFVGVGSFCPMGTLLIAWSSYRQRKWFACFLMTGISLLPCILIPLYIKDTAFFQYITLLSMLIAGAFVCLVASDWHSLGNITFARRFWAFLPLIVSVLLFCIGHLHHSIIQRECTEIRNRIEKRLEYSMSVEDCRARFASGLPVSEEPLKSLFAEHKKLDNALMVLKGNETLQEVKTLFQQFQEQHHDYVKAVEALIQLPPQKIQHDVPENSLLYEILLPELSVFRNAARYFAWKMIANADNRQCVDECNQHIVSIRNYALENATLIHTMIAITIEHIRIDALCHCLPYGGYAENEWRNLLGEEPQWHWLYARTLAEESIMFDDTVRLFLATSSVETLQKLMQDMTGIEQHFPSMLLSLYCRMLEYDYHLGLNNTEKIITLLLNGDTSRLDIEKWETELVSDAKKQGAIMSMMFMPALSKGIMKYQILMTTHGAAILAWKVLEYQQLHDGKLPNTLEDMDLPDKEFWKDQGLAYEKGELKLKTLDENPPLTTYGFRLYSFAFEDKYRPPQGSQEAKCSVTIPLSEQ